MKRQQRAMTLSEFGNAIGRRPVTEHAGVCWRCYLPGVVFAGPEGQSDVDLVIIGAGPNGRRACEDFVGRIRGKVARRYTAGKREEFPVPRSLKP